MTGRTVLHLTVSDPDDVPGLRHLAGRLARLLGLDGADTTRVATSVSELARHVQHALPAQLDFDVVESVADEPPALTITFTCTGELHLPGDPNIAGAVARLVDAITVRGDGVTIAKELPAPVSDARLAEVRDALRTEKPQDLRALLQNQNEELITALSLLRGREAELLQVNRELEETNRGVIALYAELEERAAEVRNAQRAVFEELERALRPPPPHVPGLELAVRYVPAQANSPTGGDLYDWFVLPDGTVHITVVDVQGHGVESTRDALHITHATRTLALEGHGVGDILERVDGLFRSLGSDVVGTALLARFDVRTGTMLLAGGGHPYALRVSAAGDARYLTAPGRPFGYEGAGSAGVTSVSLEPHETVLLYTDGLIEIRHDIVEGMAALRSSAAMSAHLPLPRQLDTTVARCMQGEQLNDDMLLIGIRWEPT